MGWKSIVRKVAVHAENHFDSLKNALWERTRRNAPVCILPYLGFGTAGMVSMRARVLQNRHVRPASDQDSIWRNMLNFYRRIESDELPNAQVTATFAGREKTITADEEGYLLIRFAFDGALPAEKTWHDVQLQFDDGNRRDEATGQVLIPPHTAQFGVISDLDDTVIRTDVTHLLRLARNTFLKNSRTRLPFPGVAAFYSALQQGTAASAFNPIFYVSNSPWNLYDLFLDFFEVRGIPPGPMFLRDTGLTERYLLASKSHKFDVIERLLSTYPNLQFILIGDSGEHDPDIYLQITQAYPKRIAAIYIRDVDPEVGGTRRDQHVHDLAEQVQQAGSSMLLVPDTLAAARHALEKGYITAAALTNIEAAVQDDQQQPDALEALINAEAD